MKNEIQINDELIAKYLTGGASPDEAIALNDWLADPANQLYFKRLQHTWNATLPSKSPRSIELEKAWSEVDVKRKRIPSDLITKDTTSYRFPKIAFRIAASVILVLAFGLVIYFSSNRVSGTIRISSTDSLRHYKFADNSTVVLHQNSTISFPETFDKNLREVQLTEGEAFFEVAPNTEAPFIIHTKMANIKVIGTEFNVVLSSNSLQVSVAQGKVMVYSATDSIYLGPGNNASFGSEASTKIQLSDPNAWAYATHKLIFKDTPLSDVFRYVEKAKLCSIKLHNKDIGNCKLTATFDNVSTDYMLTLISEALNLTVTRNDNIFTVGGEGCQ